MSYSQRSQSQARFSTSAPPGPPQSEPNGQLGVCPMSHSQRSQSQARSSTSAPPGPAQPEPNGQLGVCPMSQRSQSQAPARSSTSALPGPAQPEPNVPGEQGAFRLTPGTATKRKRPVQMTPDECYEHISTAIQQALLVTTNEDFRQRSFRALSVSNAHEAKDALKRKLTGFFDPEPGTGSTTFPRAQMNPSGPSSVVQVMQGLQNKDTSGILLPPSAVDLKMETASVCDEFSSSQYQSSSDEGNGPTSTPKLTSAELREWLRGRGRSVSNSQVSYSSQPRSQPSQHSYSQR